jgi:hypothetical protein
MHRRRAVGAGVVVLLFASALALWARGGATSNAYDGHQAAPNRTNTAGSAPSNGSASGGAASGTAAGGARGGPSLAPFPISTNISDFNRGPVTVTFSATGDKYIGGVAWIVEGQSRHSRFTVASPMSVSIRAPYGKRAAMTVQVAADGVTATCSIAINGVVKIKVTARGANHVGACVL